MREGVSVKFNAAAFLFLVLSLSNVAWAQVTLTADGTAASDFTGNVIFSVDNLTYTVADQVVIDGNFLNSSGTIVGSTLKFAGGSSSIGTIGAQSSLLDTVIFNSADNGSELTLSNDVWASSVIFGNGPNTSPSETQITISGSGIRFGGDVTFANYYTLLEVGESRNTITGTLELSAGALSFTLGADTDLTLKDGAGSGKLTTGGLTLTGTDSELFILNYADSIRDGSTYTLIESGTAISGSYAQDEDSGFVVDNSYVLNSEVAVDGTNVVLTVSRADDEYITKSFSSGHFSNGAALALGKIARAGQQQGDLISVINALDVNDYGYGNNYANLARQVQLLAPVANNSFSLTLLDATNLALHPTTKRFFSRDTNLDWQEKASLEAWTSAYTQQGSQNGLDYFDGYDTSIQGGVVGIDYLVTPKWLTGVAVASGGAQITQKGFRSGETAQLNHQLYTLYASLNEAPFAMDVALSSGTGVLQTKRQTAIDRTASGEQDYTLQEARLSGGYRNLLYDGRSVLIPLAGLEWAEVKQARYEETGAGDLSLVYDDHTQQRLRWMLGVEHQTDWEVWDTPTRWTLSLLNYRDSGLTNLDMTTHYSGQTQADLREFTTPTKPVKTNEIQLNTAFDLEVAEQGHLQLGYRLDHRTGFNSHSGNLKFGWRF